MHGDSFKASIISGEPEPSKTVPSSNDVLINSSIIKEDNPGQPTEDAIEEVKVEYEKQASDSTWIILALLSGLLFGLGNTAFGISCSQHGVFGAGFPAPICILLIALYRGVEACRLKRRTGRFVDKAKSNYWRVSERDNFVRSSGYEFNWTNVMRVVLTQGLPSLCGLVLVSYAFKYALLA